MHNIMISKGKILNALAEEDSSPLTTSLRFGDDHRSGFFLHVLSEIIELGRQHPCFGIEVIITLKLLGHFDQIPSQIVLSGEVEHTWKVIDLLVQFHLG